MSVLPWLYGITEFKELFLRKWLCGFQELLYLGNFGEVERIVPVRKDSLQDLGRKFLGVEVYKFGLVGSFNYLLVAILSEGEVRKENSYVG